MAQPTRFPSGVSVSNRGSGITKEVVRKHRVIPISYADGTSENATGFTFPDACLIHNVYVHVLTAEATGTTKTIDVGTQGTSNDPDGFIAGVNVASTGLKRPTLATGSETVGALLTVESEAGATDATIREPNVSAGGDEVSWTPGSADFAELKAEIIIEYDEIKNGATS